MRKLAVFVTGFALLATACAKSSENVKDTSSDQFCVATERTRIDFSILNDVRTAIELYSVYKDVAQDKELALVHTLESLFNWLGVDSSNIPQWARDIVEEEIQSSQGNPDFGVMNKVYERLIEDPRYSDLKDPARLEQLLEVMIAGTIDALGDPFAGYITADRWLAGGEDQGLSGSFVGFGFTLGTNARGEISLTSILSATPAQKAGLQTGDAVISINGLSIENCTQQQFSLQLKLLEDPNVRFVVARERPNSLEREMLDILVIKEEIKLLDIVTYPGVDLPDGRGNTSERLAYNCGSSVTFGKPCPFDDENGNPEVLYIKLNNFSRQMYFDLEYFLDNIDQAQFKAVVLDLRGNGGGYPAHCPNAPQRYDTCVDAANLFMSTTGYIRVTQDASGNMSYTRGTLGLNWVSEDLPMTILMDKDSASASEGLAAALRDNGRAIIVNADSRSHGKGMTSRFLPLRQGTYGGMQISVGFFLTPNGEMIEKIDTTGDGYYDVGGLAPDIHIPWSNRDHSENGRDVNHDPTLRAALDWLVEQLSR